MYGLNSWSARCARCQRRRAARHALRPALAASEWRARASGRYRQGWWAPGIEAAAALGAPRSRLLAVLRHERTIGQPPRIGHGLRLASAVGMLYNASDMPWTHLHEERDDDLRLCGCGGLGGQGPRKM